MCDLYRDRIQDHEGRHLVNDSDSIKEIRSRWPPESAPKGFLIGKFAQALYDLQILLAALQHSEKELAVMKDKNARLLALLSERKQV